MARNDGTWQKAQITDLIYQTLHKTLGMSPQDAQRAAEQVMAGEDKRPLDEIAANPSK